MRRAMILLASGMLAGVLVAGCGDNTPTGPGTGEETGGGGGTPPPATASVTVGDIFFQSDRNGTSNPAVDTVAVNGTVTWTWALSVTMSHSVDSEGSPSFPRSPIMAGAGSTHQATFTAPGTYEYDGAVHGQLMTGRIVVVDTASLQPSPDTMPTASRGG